MARTFDLPSPKLLQQSAQSEAASLADLLATIEPGQSVHGARRRIKQLRSLLRLLRSAFGEAAYKQVNSELRTAADALAGHRRAEALVATAAKHVPADGHGARFWCGLAEAHRNAHLHEEDPVKALVTARDAAARAADVMAKAPLTPTGAVGEAFLGGYGKARKLLRRGLESGDAETLHEARKYVIHHLHHLKLLQPEPGRRLAQLEVLREILGDLNDLDELEQLAEGSAVTEDEGRAMRKSRKRLLRRASKTTDALFRHNAAALGKRMRHAAGPRSP